MPQVPTGCFGGGGKCQRSPLVRTARVRTYIRKRGLRATHTVLILCSARRLGTNLVPLEPEALPHRFQARFCASLSCNASSSCSKANTLALVAVSCIVKHYTAHTGTKKGNTLTNFFFFRVILSFVPLCVALSFTMSQIYLGRFALIEHRILFVPESLRNINQFPAFIDRLNDCGSLCMPG